MAVMVAAPRLLVSRELQKAERRTVGKWVLDFWRSARGHRTSVRKDSRERPFRQVVNVCTRLIKKVRLTGLTVSNSAEGDSGHSINHGRYGPKTGRPRGPAGFEWLIRKGVSHARPSVARCVILVALLAAGTALAQGFPQAPVNLKEAEAQGRQRLSMQNLRTYVPGTDEVKGTTDKSTKHLRPDGSFQRKGFKDFSGSWPFDEAKNAYCRFVYKTKRLDKSCSAVFRAREGEFFLDYDLKHGFYSHTWTPAKAG